MLLLVAHTVRADEDGTEKRESAMSRKPVKYELDFDHPLRLIQPQKAKLEALNAALDSAIDYSDSPPLTDDFRKHAVRNPFYRPTKASTTVRVDTDVLLWLKSKGKGYQTRLNAILRDAMLKELNKG